MMLLGLGACSHERVLSTEEAERYGLTAQIYDAPICPNKFENGVLKVSGPCEEVTCLPEKADKKVVCRARPQKKFTK